MSVLRLVGIPIPRRTCWLCLLLGSIVLVPCAVAPADTAIDRTLESMWRRGMTDSAIYYTAARREQAGDNIDTKARWTMRLMESHARAALASEDSEASSWTACRSILSEFETRHSESKRLPWIRWQATRCLLLQAQGGLASYLAVPTKTQIREEALQTIRTILEDADSQEKDVRRRLPIASRQSLIGGTEASPGDLSELLVDIGLLRCEALLIRSRLYDPGSSDRIAAATQVDTQSVGILNSAGQSWASRDALLIAQAIAHLEIGKQQQGLLTLSRLAREAGNDSVRVQAAYRTIEYLASNDQLSRAQSIMPLLSGMGPYEDLAKIHVGLAIVKKSDGPKREQQISALVQLSKDMGTAYGTYWQHRAEALLVGLVKAESSAGNTEMATELMLVEVRQLLAADDPQGATQKLLQFRDIEAASQRSASAIQLADYACALLAHQERWLEAAQAAEETALQFSGDPQAAATHRAAITAVTEALRSDGRNAELRKRYQDLLTQQLETWPDDEESKEPLEWLKKWLQGTGQSKEFSAVLLRQAAASKNDRWQRKLLVQWLSSLSSLSAVERNQAVDSLKPLFSDHRGNQRENARTIGLAADMLQLWPEPPAADEQSQELNRLLRSASGNTNRVLLSGLQLLTSVRDSNEAEAKRLSEAWTPDQVTQEERTALAYAMVEAIDFARTGRKSRWVRYTQLDSSVAKELQSAKATIFQATGHRIDLWNGNMSQALGALTQLTDDQPRNGILSLSLATALADSGEARLSDSSKLAARVATSSPPGSDMNLTARWRLIQNDILAGDTAKAQAAAKLLLASQPIESEVWKQRFQAAAGE